MANTVRLPWLCALFLLFSTDSSSGAPSGNNLPKRIVTKSLMLTNGLDYGDWGAIEYCEDGSFARDTEAQFEDYSFLETDETALNALKLYCNTPDGHHTGYITSTIGEKGEWKGMKTCPTGLMTGMRARVLQPQGTLGDDVAVQNVEFDCGYGESSVMAIDETTNIKQGEWSAWAKCDTGSAICGIEMRYEKPNLVIDTTAISNVAMFCCAMEKTTTTTMAPMTTTKASTTLPLVTTKTTTPIAVTSTLPPTTTPIPPVTSTLSPTTTPIPPVTSTLPPTTTPIPPVTSTLSPTTTPIPPVTSTLPPTTTPIPPVTSTLPPITTPIPVTST